MSARKTNQSDSRRYYQWLDKAQTDLHSARLLLGAGGDHASVVYHCHQVIEKALKGYLLFSARRHFDGHNITFLVKQAIRQDGEFEPFLDKTPPFNRYYIETRYPTDLPFEISEKELKNAFDLGQEIYRTVARKIVHDLREDIPIEE